MTGLFIVFEGSEGCGKTTQTQRLTKRLLTMGRNPIPIREPGGTKTGEMIRKMLKDNLAGEDLTPVAELLLFEAARAQLIEKVVIPTLKSGADVICDRFTDSTVAYQGYARGIDLCMVKCLNKFATFECQPSLTIILDIDPEIGLKRTVEKRGEQGKQLDKIEQEDIEFHHKVRKAYLLMSKNVPGKVVLDASIEADKLEEQIWSRVQSLLPPS